MSAARSLRHQQSHERILDAAARAVRRSGVAGVGVAEVMKEAGLTHGGFYAHFESRDALLAEALEHAGSRSNANVRERMRARMEAGESPLRALVSEYLSGLHMEALELGCPVAAVGSDMQRAGDGLREVSQSRVRGLARLVEETLAPDTAPGSAWAIAASLVGAIQLARVLGAEEGTKVMQACREALLAQYDRPATQA
ncbi:putative HTH-type transcriptional regulator Rv0196 [Massilia sp. Bi118]|uniref:TetR/AcrR family transcriptional regulator n=1 Tax=Massilia sp. Bi118 TaxID=2822346 RepID=UPI001D7FD42C|nr:TetR/AcrR family transcriptional regulator [Massilia sp. Bi118]CAH0193814.1 putative HTH-type transcriptional regulator Rv0196 [Massilia sp. Bi118]